MVLPQMETLGITMQTEVVTTTTQTAPTKLGTPMKTELVTPLIPMETHGLPTRVVTTITTMPMVITNTTRLILAPTITTTAQVCFGTSTITPLASGSKWTLQF